MKRERLERMVKGWFVGSFDPTVLRTDQVEVAVKHYRKGDSEGRHYHKVATEITVIALGRVRMNGVDYESGDIVVLEPNEPTDFEALEDSITAVVKYPSSVNDKYPGNPRDD